MARKNVAIVETLVSDPPSGSRFSFAIGTSVVKERGELTNVGSAKYVANEYSLVAVFLIPLAKLMKQRSRDAGSCASSFLHFQSNL